MVTESILPDFKLGVPGSFEWELLKSVIIEEEKSRVRTWKGDIYALYLMWKDLYSIGASRLSDFSAHDRSFSGRGKSTTITITPEYILAKRENNRSNNNRHFDYEAEIPKELLPEKYLGKNSILEVKRFTIVIGFNDIQKLYSYLEI